MDGFGTGGARKRMYMIAVDAIIAVDGGGTHRTCDRSRCLSDRSRCLRQRRAILVYMLRH